MCVWVSVCVRAHHKAILAGFRNMAVVKIIPFIVVLVLCVGSICDISTVMPLVLTTDTHNALLPFPQSGWRQHTGRT